MSIEVRSAKPQAKAREHYRHFVAITTRWSDNDIYGHINNAVYYTYFDAAVNSTLIERGLLDIHAGTAIGLVVETQCHYFAPLAFPQVLEAGLRVAHLGNSSVRYDIGIFPRGAELAAACGHLVHVLVDRSSRRPTAFNPAWRAALTNLT
jgi:acyl-CoA thioester hydrolase